MKLCVWMLSLVLFIFCASVSMAATYYVRTNGGTSDQCNGTADAAYPGSGTNQPCAWAHPFWALTLNDDTASWKLAGGDTLNIGSGSYMMGYGAPNTQWCSTFWPWSCRLPAVPSGPDPQHPTSIFGKGWDLGCSSPPELWGTERAEMIIDLTASSNILIDCLDITDHSKCANNHPDQAIACQRDTYPMGPYADRGIYAEDSSNVILRHLNIHGLASAGIHAGRIADWSITDVRISGNGYVGWDGDIYGDDSNSGTIVFRRIAVENNGCPEYYPDKTTWGNCFDQAYDGYGDGIATGATGGHWIIEDSVVANNTQDGIDFLYVSRVPEQTQIEIRRTKVYGNAGNQIKVNGPAMIENVVAVGNCAWFEGKPIAHYMGLLCRAGGATLVLDFGGGHHSSVVNSTIVGYGDILAGVQCDTLAVCNTSDEVVFANNIFRGYGDYFDPNDQAAFIYVDNETNPPFPGKVTGTHNLAWDVKFSPTFPQESDASIIVADPKFRDPGIDTFDGRLLPQSPAVDSGLAAGSLSGLIPSDDMDHQTRPLGSGVERGAYEHCTQQEVMRPAAPVVPYSSVIPAYADAATGEEIDIRAVSLNESVIFNRDDITVTLRGGFTCDFTANPYQSTIVGLMSVLKGAVILDRIALQ